MYELENKKPLPTIYKQIKRIRKNQGYRLTKEDAAYILAGQLGIDIAKYISKEELNRLGNFITTIGVKTMKTRVSPSRQTFDLKIGGITTKIPCLPKKEIESCINMAKTYQLFYMLENSIRYLILESFEKQGNKNWWDNKVPVKIRTDVVKRIHKENENRWLATRGYHHIFYTNFGDLKEIIIANWDIFKQHFPNQHWIASRMQDLEFSRNIIAHNNKLPDNEIKRIKLYFNDWIKQIRE